MKQLAFDELNIDEAIEELLNNYEISSEEFEEYFDEMELSESEKKKRKSFAEDFEQMMITIFILYLLMRKYDRINEEFIVNELESKYSEIASKYMSLDKATKDYIKEFSQETIDVTARHEDEKYFTSKERAILLSENEANTTLGHAQYLNALKNGYKRKQWITEKDNKVRETHREVDNLIIPINEPFVVGDSLMMFAHDALSFGADAEEISNCRCTTKYLK